MNQIINRINISFGNRGWKLRWDGIDEVEIKCFLYDPFYITLFSTSITDVVTKAKLRYVLEDLVKNLSEKICDYSAALRKINDQAIRAKSSATDCTYGILINSEKLALSLTEESAKALASSICDDIQAIIKFIIREHVRDVDREAKARAAAREAQKAEAREARAAAREAQKAAQEADKKK